MLVDHGQMCTFLPDIYFDIQTISPTLPSQSPSYLGTVLRYCLVHVCFYSLCGKCHKSATKFHQLSVLLQAISVASLLRPTYSRPNTTKHFHCLSVLLTVPQVLSRFFCKTEGWCEHCRTCFYSITWLLNYTSFLFYFFFFSINPRILYHFHWDLFILIYYFFLTAFIK